MARNGQIVNDTEMYGLSRQASRVCDRRRRTIAIEYLQQKMLLVPERPVQPATLIPSLLR